MNLEQKQVLALVQTGELRRLYANTYYSLVDRLDEAGYLEESYVPGRYPGNFSRSTGAYVFLMIQTGRLDLAHRALRCVLDTMQRHALRPMCLANPAACRTGPSGRSWIWWTRLTARPIFCRPTANWCSGMGAKLCMKNTGP